MKGSTWRNGCAVVGVLFAGLAYWTALGGVSVITGMDILVAAVFFHAALLWHEWVKDGHNRRDTG